MNRIKVNLCRGLTTCLLCVGPPLEFWFETMVGMWVWHGGDAFSLFLSIFDMSRRLTLWYFVFLCLVFLSRRVLCFLLGALVLTLYIDVVLSLSIRWKSIYVCITVLNYNTYMYVIQIQPNADKPVSMAIHECRFAGIWIRSRCVVHYSACNIMFVSGIIRIALSIGDATA